MLILFTTQLYYNKILSRSYENTVLEYIENDTYLVLYDILKKYYLYLKSINQLSLIYDTNEKIKSNENIFNLYIKYKK